MAWQRLLTMGKGQTAQRDDVKCLPAVRCLCHALLRLALPSFSPPLHAFPPPAASALARRLASQQLSSKFRLASPSSDRRYCPSLVPGRDGPATFAIHHTVRRSRRLRQRFISSQVQVQGWRRPVRRSLPARQPSSPVAQ